MFPWVDGFHWTPLHITFLSLFFSALILVVSTFISGAWRTFKDFRSNRAIDLCWRAEFAQLPEAERCCRHQLAGRLDARICDNAFDCRSCQKYPEFAALPARLPAGNAGIGYDDRLLYHRGHTWVRPEWDGTYTIGLDEFARHLVGRPDFVKLPAIGADIASDGVAWRMRKNGHEIRVRAPIEGTVMCRGGDGEGWYLNVLPHGTPNLRHLLSGAEVAGWLTGEIDRLQLQLAAPNATACLADGGALMPDLMDAELRADWDTVLAGTFLDS